ncbi:MAG: hypothetical protein J6M24_07370 [Lachnospiraceae bacterium]|nr:hypothetical protein [Lachnospiraceae bacterium]
MAKSKFTYEVKDFEPNYKKNPVAKLVGALICLAVLALVSAAVFFIFKKEEKKKLTPGETVKEAVSDCFSHLFGEKSPVTEGMGLEESIKLIESGRFGYRADLRLKEIKDFGLGVEQYISGVGVSFDGDADLKKHRINGNVSGSWTVVALDVLQYVYDGNVFALSSDDFFKETLTITPSEVLPFIYMGNAIEKITPETEAEKTGERKSFTVGGREISCDAYKIKVISDWLNDTAEMTAYIDRNNRLICLEGKYDKKADISFKLSLDGKDHPSDKLEFSFSSVIKEVPVDGRLVIDSENTKEGRTSKISGELKIKELKLSADMKLEFSYADKSFKLDFSGNDEVKTANVMAAGKMVFEKGNTKMKVESLSLEYGGEKIGTAGITLTLKGENKGEVDTGYPTVRVIELKDFTKENFEEIKEQVMKRVNEYMEIFKKFI